MTLSKAIVDEELALADPQLLGSPGGNSPRRMVSTESIREEARDIKTSLGFTDYFAYRHL